jgi:hypothetical protein
MSKQKYRPISVHFDPTDETDKKILDWLEAKKNKMNSYSAQIRKALLEYIENHSASQP